MQQGSASFFKNKQKLLQVGMGVDPTRRLNGQKFFGSFFQKRTPSLLLRFVRHMPPHVDIKPP
jgi:hypothetical protein